MRQSTSGRRFLSVLRGVLLLSIIILGCGKGSGDPSASKAADSSLIVYQPPEGRFARDLGITGGPITADQAKAIAEAATGGTAIEVERENENGVQVFGVEILLDGLKKDVKVRISDGAVLQIESDDDDDEDEDEDEDDGDNNDSDDGDDGDNDDGED